MYTQLFLALLLATGCTCRELCALLNVCPTAANPDEYLTTPQIIRRHGYEAESHTIVTDDGYILTLHRIPRPRNGTRGGQPVFLQHGLLSSSADWVDTDTNSLAFVLADTGYDVWMGNARGNFYSKAHVSYLIDEPKFWNFSWHEMGVKDLPASLYHVSNVTGKGGEIIYVGHSMGTTMFFVLSSTLGNVSKLVKMMVAMAPVAYMTHVRSPIRYLTPFVKDFQWVAKHLGLNEFLPSNKILKFLAYDCELLNVNKQICEDIIFVICGFDKAQFNTTKLPVILSHIPAGTSTKTVVHYAQEIDGVGAFKQFDYGPAGNLIQYGVPTPPKYKLLNIKTPVYLMYAENDLLASPIDVARLSRNITNLVGLYKVPFEKFNHVDFVFGKDAPKLVYEPMMRVIGKFRTTGD